MPKTNTVHTPSHTTKQVILLEPQKDGMTDREDGVDLSGVPDDISFEQSIDLNKVLIGENTRLSDKVNDWIDHHEFQRRLNPDAVSEPEETTETKKD